MDKEKIVEEFGYLIAEARAVFKKEPLTEDDIIDAYNMCEEQLDLLYRLIYGISKEESEKQGDAAIKRLQDQNN
ncbi:MAG: ABC transporter [Hoylesella enoeca]|uniref:ABC transporter n=1 Tax=Hoylesella enoeca TaxID=76123 RepID=UPI003FA0E561